MKLRVVPSKPMDAFLLELRPEDAREVSPGWQFGVRDAVTRFGAYSAFEGDDLIAMYGVTEGATWLSPWLLSSSRISNHRKEVLRRARAAVENLVREAVLKDKAIFNNIPKDSPSNRRFVAFLGFEFRPTQDPRWDIFFHPSCVNPRP